MRSHNFWRCLYTFISIHISMYSLHTYVWMILSSITFFQMIISFYFLLSVFIPFFFLSLCFSSNVLFIIFILFTYKGKQNTKSFMWILTKGTHFLRSLPQTSWCSSNPKSFQCNDELYLLCIRTDVKDSTRCYSFHPSVGCRGLWNWYRSLE